MDQEENWHSLSVDDCLEELGTSRRGLTEKEAERRLQVYGPNEVAEAKGISKVQILVSQLKNPLNLVLVAAALISYFAGKTIDTIVITIIIIFNAAMGFIQEYRAEKAIQALKKMVTLEADVLRDSEKEGEHGYEVREKASSIVPGDVVILEAGDKVPADARIIEAHNLEIDESMLTGESVPVSKRADAMPEKLSVADRKNIAYSGSVVTKGRGKAVVFATGPRTEMGKIAQLIQETEVVEAPIQRRTKDLSLKLGFFALLASTTTLTIGLVRGFEFTEILLFALASAVSAIPEGLLVVMTITLAVGAHRMVRRNALIRKLNAVETLGSVTAICTDKTGTLTTNQMTVRNIFVDNRTVKVTGVGFAPEGSFEADGREIRPEEHKSLELLLKVGVLCNDSRLRRHETEEGCTWEVTGDPTEGALAVAAAKAGLLRDELDEELPRVGEIPFDPANRYMVTFHQESESKLLAFAKGAPETILDMCSEVQLGDERRALTEEVRQELVRRDRELAKDALRVLGFAYGETAPESLDECNMGIQRGATKLVFLGLAGMIDPPREEAKDSIRLCRSAGIRVIMSTGDHRLTAEAIAKEIGIIGQGASGAITGDDLDKLEDDQLDAVIEKSFVFARVSPSHKHRIVESLKRKGHIVAMTGDGVNDAPALKTADVGISMGITGTDVTKETAEMILTDDNFASIVNAVEEGRVVFENIRKVVKYLVTTNTGEIMTILTCLILFPWAPLILTPIMILWINLATDGLLDKTLALEPAEEDIMMKSPREPDEKIIDREMVRNVIILGASMAIGTLFLFIRELMNGDIGRARTLAFVTMAMFQVFNALNCRSRTKSVFSLGVFTNRYLVLGMIGSVSSLYLATTLPVLQTALGTVSLGYLDWIVIALIASSILVLDEIRKLFRRVLRERAGIAA